MKVFDAIAEAVHDWYSETGIAATRVLLHPTNYNELIEEVSYETVRSTFPTPSSGTNLRGLHLNTAVSGLEVLVAAQEVIDEFVLSDNNQNMKRVVLLEDGNVRTVLDAPKVLAVKRSKLFLKRDAKGKYFQDLDAAWSERLLKDVSEAFDLIIIFHDTFGYREGLGIWPLTSLKITIKHLRLQNIGVADYDSRERLEAFQVWKERILEVGGRIKRASNMRDINCFSVPGLTVGDHITWVDESGDSSKGVVIEKSKSFMELAKDRESRSNW